jgi:YegS/Rv2252/BmrU family lipid kinase
MDDTKKIKLIINPISGTATKKGLAEKIEKSMTRQGYEIDTQLTTGRGDATRFAQEAIAHNYHAVLACGGDGTVNETATALCGSKVALGIIPAGSGNGLARHLGIPIDPILSLDVIEEHHIVDCDYGTVNNQPFFCTFGVGFDAAVSHRFARQHRRGPLSYIKSAISEYIQFNPQTYTISANGEILTEKAFLVACCNASQYGNNAYIAPEASITDGLLDITIVHSGSPLDTAVFGMDLMTGYINRNTLIHSFRTPAAAIYRNGDGPAHLDGEPIVMPDIMDVRCHRHDLRIFVPTSETVFRPILTPMSAMMRDIKIAAQNLIRK